MKDSTHETELGSYIGRMLRDNFGKGPESVFVSIGHVYLAIYLRNFLSPMERVLLEQGNEQMVQKTRDLLMESLIPEIKAYINAVTGATVHELYYDWGLHNRSGCIVVVVEEPFPSNSDFSEDYEGKAVVHKEVIAISSEVQRAPEEVYSCQLNTRKILVVRTGILVPIEKEFIRLGLREELRIAKRNLEKSYLHNNSHVGAALNRQIADVFVDWDFDRDKSVISYLIHPKKS